MSRDAKTSNIEWIGQIPKTWNTNKVKYVTKCMDGKRVPVDASQRTPGPYPYWGAGSITDHVDKFLFDEELVLLGEDGAPFFDKTRNVAFLINEKVWINNHIHVLKPQKNIDASFLCYALNSVDYREYINGAIINKLTQSDMKTINIPYPPLPEQRQIVSFLDRKCSAIDTAIEKTKKSIEKLEEYKKAVITKAVTKGIDPNAKMKDSRIEWIGEIPEDWDILRGKFIFKKLSRSVKDTDDVITCFRDGEVTLRKNRREEGFTFSDKEIGYQGIEPGDLVVHGMDGFAGSIGISDSRGKATPVLNVLDSNQNKKYYMYYLRSMAYGDVFNAIATGIRVRSCNLNWNKLAELSYPVPSKETQQAIVDYIDDKLAKTDALVAKKQEAISKWEEYKKSLIYYAVTGKIDCKNEVI